MQGNGVECRWLRRRGGYEYERKGREEIEGEERVIEEEEVGKETGEEMLRSAGNVGCRKYDDGGVQGMRWDRGRGEGGMQCLS